MKKVIFLLLALCIASFGIYSCQKDSAEKAGEAVAPNITVTDRADFEGCDECAETCTDCCLQFIAYEGGTGFGFINPATGLSTYRTLYGPDTTYVCAGSGWVAIFGYGKGKITVCSTGDWFEKLNFNAPYPQKTLSWNCHL